MKEFVIDLFCGAGGTSTGIHLANCDTTVTACVNHEAKAIESHRRNHPWAKHFIEDIRNPEVVFFLKLRVDALRKLYPDCIITIWASLECTNHSNAKGGMSRDADSRTLAEHLFMYLDGLKPDYLMIENVREFMDWGPLRIKEDVKKSKKGKYSTLLPDPKSKTKAVKFVMMPVKELKGIDYNKWVSEIENRGFKYDHRILDAADFEAFTSRKRYFSQFAKGDLPIDWPEPTAAQFPEKVKLKTGKKLKKWKAVKEVLRLDVEGVSIFNRKIPLVENSEKRIYAGLVKFVANGDESFIQSYYSGSPMQRNHSLNGPARTVRTNNCMAVVQTSFLNSYYGNGNAHSIDKPCPTISTKDRFSKINYLMLSYSNGKNLKSINGPAATVVKNDKHNLINCWMMTTSFDNKGRSIDKPAPTVLAGRKHHYIVNPQYNNPGNSVEKPCPVIIARQDKKPLGLVICDTSAESFAIPIYEDDTETMVKIKQFMAAYGIVDIKMRMLLVEELLRIQGFPEGYELVGNQTDKKKFIGNSVEVTTAKKLFEAHHAALVEYFELKNAA